MSAAGTSGQAEGSNAPPRLLVSHPAVVRPEGEMLPGVLAEAGPVATQGAARDRQASASRGLREQSGVQTAISPNTEIPQQQLTHAQRQLQEYSQQLNYPWYQPHRSAPFQQGSCCIIAGISVVENICAMLTV